MIIDAHNHPDWHGHDLQRTLANMDEHNIDKAWMLSLEAPIEEYGPSYRRVLPPVRGGVALPFERCLSYVERAPDRFVLGYAPDPRRPDAVDRLAAAIDIYNVRVCGEIKLRMMLDNPDALRLFRFCGQRGLPVTIHLGVEETPQSRGAYSDWWYGGDMDTFERAVRACPDTIFLGHASGFWAHISGEVQYDAASYPTGPVQPGGKVIDMMRRYPNLYCDISAHSGYNALQRDAAFARDFLLEFQDRILFGRDNFESDHQRFLDGIDLPADTLAKVYSGNAHRLVASEGAASCCH